MIQHGAKITQHVCAFFPSGEGFHFFRRPPDAADCAEAKEQPSTQNLILPPSLPWLAVEELSSISILSICTC